MARKTNVEINGKKYSKVTKTIGHKDDGTPIKKQFYGVSKKEAEDKAIKYMQKLKSGFSVDFDKITIEQLVNTWLFEIKIHELKKTSLQRYDITYRKYIKNSPIAYLTVYNCKSLPIQQYYNSLVDILSYESIHTINKVLKGAFNYAIAEGYTIKNPCQEIKIPKINEVTDNIDKIEIFNDDEIKKIIKNCKEKINAGSKSRIYYAILITLGSGLRQAELLALDNANANDKIFVKKQLQRTATYKNNKIDHYNLEFQTPKTKHSIRIVDIPESTQEVIKKLKIINKEKFEKLNKEFNDKTLLFFNYSGEPLEKTVLRKSWINFLNKLDIPYKKWHTLRHTYASILFKNGVDVKSVQELLGHSKVNTTLEIYVHIFPETKKNAVNSINKILSI